MPLAQAFWCEKDKHMSNTWKYLGKTLFRMLTLLIAVSILAFVLVVNSPVDPLVSYIGTSSTISQEAKQEIIDYWQLDAPPAERFLTWANHLLHGDWGTSITYKQPVLKVIGERLQYSIWLMLIAWILSGVIGFFLGIAAAVKRGSIFDKVTKVFCLVLQSAPTFWLALLILSLFAVKLQWFPIGLAAPMGVAAEDVSLGDRIYHMILPALTLSLLGVGKMTLYTRQKLIEILNSDYILFAKARGESMRQIIRRHGFRNIAMPALTVQCASFSELFGGIALAETVFSYPGIGTATTAAGLNGDVPLLLGIAVISAVFVFCGNMAANILYAVLDPRIKEGSSRES